KYAVLTDILGEEDHLGDMDFKVAGTKNGITAFQMDIKIDSITFDIMKKALAQAKEARLSILEKMDRTISAPEKEVSEFAPKIRIVKIPKDKIALVIGPGGSMIKDIIAKTQTNININDEGDQGTATISGTDIKGVEKAEETIKEITMDVEVGKTYKGVVKRIMDFGAFVGIPGKKEGLVHISKIAKERVNKVADVLKIDQEVRVKVVEVDRMGRINLSMKDAEE
ncbi:MAG: S1 RNA-binding domain-containing protein, partial [Spirochaetes bacterium]|nr:S1 RNA-binding domain-containing protein [Spirochaetota bacterium]